MYGECFRLLLAISFWETRKVPGYIGMVFFPFHNLACQIRADQYRYKLKLQMMKRNK